MINFTFSFDNEEDKTQFVDWWESEGYYSCVDSLEMKGLNIMFESTPDGEKIKILGEEL